jgi:hypothetical protein
MKHSHKLVRTGEGESTPRPAGPLAPAHLVEPFRRSIAGVGEAFARVLPPGSPNVTSIGRRYSALLPIGMSVLLGACAGDLAKDPAAGSLEEQQDSGTAPTTLDTDGDGLSDQTEERLGTDPAYWDSNLNGLSDAYEAQRDGLVDIELRDPVFRLRPDRGRIRSPGGCQHGANQRACGPSLRGCLPAAGVCAHRLPRGAERYDHVKSGRGNKPGVELVGVRVCREHPQHESVRYVGSKRHGRDEVKPHRFRGFRVRDSDRIAYNNDRAELHHLQDRRSNERKRSCGGVADRNDHGPVVRCWADPRSDLGESRNGSHQAAPVSPSTIYGISRTGGRSAWRRSSPRGS